MNSTETVDFFINSQPPSWITAPEDDTIESGTSFSQDLEATDLQPVQYSVDDRTNFTVNANGLLENNTILQVGQYTLHVNVSDGTNDNITSITITVQDTTAPTWVQDPQNSTIEFGDPFTYYLNASDLSDITYCRNDTTSFAIDPNTGELSNSSLPIGIYWLEVWAEDPYGNNCTAVIKVNISDTTAPQWNINIEDQTLEYGESLSYDIDASDLSGIDSYWDNGSYFAFDEGGTLTNITALESGIYWVEVGVNDTLGNFATETLKITVSEPSEPSDDGSGQPIDPTLIFVIAGVVGGIGGAGAVGGVILIRKRKATTEVKASQVKSTREKKASSNGRFENNNEGYNY